VHGCKVKFPPGVKDGARMRLRGAGIHRPDKSRGDVILTVKVAFQAKNAQVALYGEDEDEPEPPPQRKKQW
jgi:DnaJ-class molecular chaperone